MTQLARLVSGLRRVVGIFRVLVTKDEAGLKQQLVQVIANKGGPRELEEVIDDVPRVGHYGLHYVAPFGAEAVAIFLGGDRSMGVVIATAHRESRPTDLLEGEVMLYNGLTGSYVKLLADGTIRSKGDWFHEGHFRATGDVLDHAEGNAVTMKVHRDAYNEHDHVETGVKTQKPVPLAE